MSIEFRFNIIEDGRYIVKIISAIYAESKFDGSPLIKLRCKISGQSRSFYIHLSPKASNSIEAFAKAFKVPLREWHNLKFLEGKKAYLYLKNENYQGRNFISVDWLKHYQ